MPAVHLGAVDYLILALYFLFAAGIGWVLRPHIRTGSDFFLSGRSFPAWIKGLAFLSANLAAQDDEKTRGFNAISFAVMTVFSSDRLLERPHVDNP